MRFVDIDLDGLVVRALLNESGAPKTTEAIWAGLPFEGKAVHAQVSGQMFRMLEQTPVPDDLPIESGEYFQHPGQVVFFPPIKEIAFCVGEAMFAATERPWELTPLAEIEAGFETWAEKGDRIQFTGPLPIRFRRSSDQTTPFRYPTPKGRKVHIDFDGTSLQATLLSDDSPKTVAALERLLPLTGFTTNSTWAGRVTRFWSANGPDGRVRLGNVEGDRSRMFHWPGYVYYDPAEEGLRICYGSGREGLPWQPAALIPVARIDGDLTPFREKASSQLQRGQLPMSIRL
jgi:hypothetical protein